jgi:para-nitrobenzyl esterase
MNDSRNTLVTTAVGKLEGSYEDGLYIFRGVPYAAPPVGERRWMPPQPLEPWRGVRPASEFGTIAPQNDMPDGPKIRIEQAQAEDCLYLNIWTPGLDKGRRPVMVWLHGGAFTGGSGSDVSYEGGYLATRGDVVVVTINYRLGMLGFLNLDVITGGQIPATGNEGLLDQVAALKWVKENIAIFGGDPGNVTVFGESAGAMSIGCLMVMPTARGYFQKAILESGVGSTAVPLDGAVNASARFLDIVGIDGDNAPALRALTVEQLLEAEMKLRTAMAGPGEMTRVSSTAPVIDGEIVPDVPNRLARQGFGKDIPAIIGTNLDEWKLFGIFQPGINTIDEAEVIKRLSGAMSVENAKRLVSAYREARNERGETVSPIELLSAINTDLMFRMPVLELVEAQNDNGQLAYNYLFTWKSPVMGGALGACHALEIGFVFGNYDDTFGGSGPEADRLSRCIQEAWAAFARNGDPSCPSIGQWPVYGKDRLTMILDNPCRVEAAPCDDERRAWDGISYQPVMP